MGKTAQQTVKAMEVGNKELKKMIKKTNITHIEDVRDRMEDLTAEVEEVNQVLGEEYNADCYDEDEMMAELEAMGDECMDGDDSFLDNIGETPSTVPAIPSAPGGTPAETTEVDAFGLPLMD